MKNFSLAGFVLAITVALTAGCQSPFGGDDEIPEHARVVIDGDPGTPLRLITSNNFQQTREPETGKMQIVLLDADTATVGVPFDDQFPLGRFARILVRVSNPDTIPTEVRLQVFLGTEKKYDQTAQLDEEPLQFGWVYF